MTPVESRIPASQLLMQYPIALPTGYDMQIIRDRVRTRGSAFDDRAGLLGKVYCIREAGVAGSPVNEYAPFYAWADAGAAAEFLWRRRGFEGIVRDFGRPAVRTWVPEARVLGPVPAALVGHAVLRTAPIQADMDLPDAMGALAARVEQWRRPDRVHLAVGGVDPNIWQTVEFATVSELDATDAGAVLFSVLHISQPAVWS